MPGRDWLQFRLRTILVCALVACVPLSWLTNKLLRARRQRLVVAAISAAGGRVWYVGSEDGRPKKSYGYEIIPYDSQQRDASGLDGLIAEARAGEVVAVDFGEAIVWRSSWQPSKRHQMDFDGQQFDSDMPGQWILHGETDRYGREIDTSVPRELHWGDLRLLDSLEVLCFADRPVTDADLLHIGALERLRCLIIQNGRAVTNAGLQHLGGLVNLRVLVIDKSQVTDEGLKSLRALGELEVLELEHAQIQGQEQLQNLRLISLRFSPLEDQGLVHLAGLAQLERLYFYDTKLTDAGLVHLAGLKALQVLHLGGTEVTFHAADAFEKRLGRCPIIR